MELTNGKHTTRYNHLDQGADYPRVTMHTAWWQRNGEHGPHDIVSIISIAQGCANMHIDINPTEARALAASLIAHADEVENARYQLAVEAEPA